MIETAKLTAVVLALGGSLAWASPAPVHAADTTATKAAVRKSEAREAAARDAQRLAAWAFNSRDHAGLPYIIVDKVNARAFAYDRKGVLIRATPVLIGMGRGDTIPSGIMQMDMYLTKPSQRITPAGRFFAEEAPNEHGERVLWVYDEGGIAIHKLSEKRTKQRRHERIVSANPDDHRITYGCINVPPAFYDQVVHPHFRGKGGMVYVLPEKTTLKAVFKSYDSEIAGASLLQSSRELQPAEVRPF
ncbi:MAG: L,D-transpeptidase [Burkholderiales bacterium]